MKPRFRSVSAMLWAFVLVFAFQAGLRAHDIPDEIVLQTYLKPEQNHLKVLLRVPLIAVTDANLPKDGPGYLALSYIDPALREAANQISSGILFLENDQRLANYELVSARISLASDRSFDTFDSALRSLRGPKLPDDTQIFYNQGFLDLEMNFPVQSIDSPFSMRVLFGRGLANRTAAYINFIKPNGDVRAFRLHDDTSLVRLDPTAGQAAWGFISAGFYQFLDSIDHLLFVIVLALPYRRVRDLIKPFAAFAVAHSITLLLSAAGAAPVGSWFNPTIGALIAMSIVYVSVENAVGATLRHRWSLAFVFGLAHGFGFAISLRDTLQFAGSHFLTALLAFNVGLELGTLIILSIVVPVVALVSQRVSERMAVIVASVLVGHTAWHWMMERMAVARLSDWPALDLPLALTIVRWLLGITVLGGAAWFAAGLIKRKPASVDAEIPEKSIVDSR